jgi:hypothetical protein
MRVLIDIPEDHLAALDALAQRNGRSRAAEVREAVGLHLGNRSGKDWIQRGFGYWRDRPAPDGGNAARLKYPVRLPSRV